MDVDGYYFFANNANTPMTSDIFFPFPTRGSNTVDSIRVFDLSRGRKVNYQRDSDNGISFVLSLTPHDTGLVEIGYRQELSDDSAVYILKTTRAWDKPLMRAEYKLLVPDSLTMTGYSYQPVKSYEIEGKKIYYWEMENFMPARDMIFHFKKDRMPERSKRDGGL